MTAPPSRRARSPRVIQLIAAVTFLSLAPSSLAADGRLVVSMLDRAEVVFLSLSGEIVGRVPTAHGPRGMALHGGKVYVAARGVEDIPGSTIAEIDAARMIKLRDIVACARCAPRALAFDSQGTLWLTGQAHQAVYLMLPPYEEPLGSVVVAWGWPTEIVPLAGREAVAVGFRGAPQAAVIDRGRSIPVDLGPVPEFVAARPGAVEAWFALNPAGQLAVVRRPDDGDPVVERFGKIRYPQGIAFTPDGRRALVTSAGEKALVVIDAVTHEEIGRLGFESAPRDLISSPDGARAALYFPETKRVAIVKLDPAAPVLEREFELAGIPGDLLWIP